MHIIKMLINIVVLFFWAQTVSSQGQGKENSGVSVSISPAQTVAKNSQYASFDIVAVVKSNTDSLRIMVQPQGQMKLIEGQVLWRGAAIANKPVKFSITIDRSRTNAAGIMVTAVVAGKSGGQLMGRDLYRFSVDRAGNKIKK